MLHDEPAIQKEAIWAISNATANCTDELMDEMVKRDIIKAIGVALKFEEPRNIFVGLEGLANVLSSGQKLAEGANNPYCLIVEQMGLLELMESLQVHNNEMVYKKVV